MMKYIITILLVLVVMQVSAQSWNRNDTTKYTWVKYKYGSRENRAMYDSVFAPPIDTMFSKVGLATKGSSLFVGNGSYWTMVSGGSGSTAVATAIDPLAADSTGLTTSDIYIRQSFVDSIRSLFGATNLFTDARIENNPVMSLTDSTIHIDTVRALCADGSRDTVLNYSKVIPAIATGYYQTTLIYFKCATGAIDTLRNSIDTIRLSPRLVPSGGIVIGYVTTFGATRTYAVASTYQRTSFGIVDILTGKLMFDSITSPSFNRVNSILQTNSTVLIPQDKKLVFTDFNNTVGLVPGYGLQHLNYSGIHTFGSVAGSDPAFVRFDKNADNGYFNLAGIRMGANGTPAASALLDLVSTTKGFLPPRMTGVQMNAIASPASGLVVYNTDSTGICYYNGSAWVKLAGGSGGTSGWGLPGNAGTDSTFNFIGTTDNKPFLVKVNNGQVGKFWTNNAIVFNNNSPYVPGYNAFSANEGAATGINSFAINSNTLAVGDNSFAQGGSRSDGFSSVALNESNSAGSHSTSMGASVSNGIYSIAGGQSNANGDTSVALNISITNGNNSFAANTSTANAGNSASFGVGTVAHNYGQTVVGIFNDTSSTESIFEIGNGDVTVQRNAMTVLSNGSVGIGTTTPLATLHNTGGTFIGNVDNGGTVSVAAKSLIVGSASNGNLTTAGGGEGSAIFAAVQDNGAEFSNTGNGAISGGFANDGAKVHNTGFANITFAKLDEHLSLAENNGSGSSLMIVYGGAGSIDTFSNGGLASLMIMNDTYGNARNNNDNSYMFGSGYNNSTDNTFNIGWGRKQLEINPDSTVIRNNTFIYGDVTVSGNGNFGSDVTALNGVFSGNVTAANLKDGSATLDFPSTAAGTASDLTVTVTGAVVGDVVSVGVPNGSVTSDNISYWGWVSAADTVTIRFNNNNLVGAVNPASGTFKIKVLQ